MVAIRNAYRPGPAPVPVPRSAPPAPSKAQALLGQVRDFLREHPQLTPTTIGRLACNNPTLVDRLEQGLDPQPITIERVETFIARFGRFAG